MPSIYSARWVLPISSLGIEDGAVAVDGARILAVGPRQTLAQQFPGASRRNFANAAILPGLVNTHSHLELTVMRGFLEREEHDFFAWLRKLTLTRTRMTAEELYFSACWGAIEAARAGITCVGDASSAAAAAMKGLRHVGLRGIVYQESFGPNPSAARDNVAKLREQIAELRAYEDELVRSGVSPHSVYTVSAPQLELISRLALEEELPLMMHTAESRAEELFMREGSGPFAEGLQRRGINWQAPGVSTIEYLQEHGVLETKPLLAHCVTVNERDLEIVKARDAAVAHCPRSNAKLGHQRAPFVKFLAHAIRVGLGSDSVASNNTCDILEEARFATLLARLGGDASAREGTQTRLAGQDIDHLPRAETALFAATLGGARALGLDNQIGALEEGMQADLVIVALGGAHQQPVRNPVDALVFSSSGSDVLLTMVAGKEVYSDGRVSGVDEGELLSRMERVARSHQEGRLADS